MPLSDALYLVDFLFEVGPTASSGMGEGPIDFGDLDAWQRQIGFVLQPWEARFLRRLSIEYLVQSQKSEKPDCPAPWKPEEFVQDLSFVAKSLKDQMLELTKI